MIVWLCGNGGDARQLLPFARRLAPRAGYFGIRGRVRQGGESRYFRKRRDDSFDIPDLEVRVRELAQRICEATHRFNPQEHPLFVAGYSNGGNAASGFCADPSFMSLLSGIAFLRPFMPHKWKRHLQDYALDLHKTPAYVGIGASDMPGHERHWREVLSGANANLTLHVEDAHHGLVREDRTHLRKWMQQIMNERKHGTP